MKIMVGRHHRAGADLLGHDLRDRHRAAPDGRPLFVARCGSCPPGWRSSLPGVVLALAPPRRRVGSHRAPGSVQLRPVLPAADRGRLSAARRRGGGGRRAAAAARRRPVVAGRRPPPAAARARCRRRGDVGVGLIVVRPGADIDPVGVLAASAPTCRSPPASCSPGGSRRRPTGSRRPGGSCSSVARSWCRSRRSSRADRRCRRPGTSWASGTSAWCARRRLRLWFRGVRRLPPRRRRCSVWPRRSPGAARVGRAGSGASLTQLVGFAVTLGASPTARCSAARRPQRSTHHIGHTSAPIGPGMLAMALFR